MNRYTTFRWTALVFAAVLVSLMAAPASALDADHRARGEAIVTRTIEYLRTQQAEDGSWSAEPGPAVTALVAAGMLASPDIDTTDTHVAAAIRYILSKQKENGGIYDEILENYNTSICLMALGRAGDDPKIAQAVRRAQDFLRDLQWTDHQTDPTGKPITPGHPWYGGAGYGKHGRPDLSNTAIMIAGLNDSGLACEDPAYINAMKFITMMQATPANEAFADRIEPSGGFIYATSTDKDNIGTPQSQAGEVTDSSGRSLLRTYGSMTYAGFMSYLYAQLDRDDPRVADAYTWIRRNYTLDENPGMGMQGYFYYLHLLSRALLAWGDPMITTTSGESHDWTNHLIEKLESLQRPDGSFLNEADRWMEGDPVLCTAYALLAVQHALQ